MNRAECPSLKSCAHLRNYICGRTSPTAGPILMQGKSNLKAIRLRFSANFSAINAKQQISVRRMKS